MKFRSVLKVVYQEGDWISAQRFADITGIGIEHARTDLYRLYKMGLATRKKFYDKRTERNHYEYKITGKGENYLEWLER